jgi:peptidoglycan/LPS O-acetylase OafA/YrhL
MPASQRVKELDGLRALSFLSVFQMHLPWNGGGAWFGYAVDVFFVLSAYLLGSRLLAEREATGTIDVRSFYKRRILRIWPLYYIVLAVAWVVSGPADRHLIPAFAGFFGNFLVGAQGHWPAPILVPLWSLCVEEQFYAAVPWLVRSRRTLRIAAWTIIVSSALLRIPFFYADVLGVGDLSWCAVFRFDALGIGLLLATEPKLPRFSTPIRWVVLAAGVYLIVYGSQCGVRLMSVIAMGAGVIVLAALSGPDVVLGHPVLTWLGERSYGLYILHAIALVFFNWQAMPALVVTVAAAAFSYRFLELPCIAYSRSRSSTISYSPSFGRFW